MVVTKDEEAIKRLYNIVKIRENKERLILLNPETVYKNIEIANTIVTEDGVKGWVNAVRYYDAQHDEQILVVDKLKE